MNTNHRTRFNACLDKKRAVAKADEDGEVADSIAVRTELMRQVHSGEKTLTEVQTELASIKRGAKKAGKLTRSQVWNKS